MKIGKMSELLKKYAPIVLDPRVLRLNMAKHRFDAIRFEMRANGHSDEEINAVIDPMIDELVESLNKDGAS